MVSRSGMLLNKSVANPSRGEKKYIGLGGKGQAYGTADRKHSGHYRAAIRNNQTIERVRTAIWAIFYHRKGKHANCLD